MENGDMSEDAVSKEQAPKLPNVQPSALETVQAQATIITFANVFGGIIAGVFLSLGKQYTQDCHALLVIFGVLGATVMFYFGVVLGGLRGLRGLGADLLRSLSQFGVGATTPPKPHPWLVRLRSWVDRYAPPQKLLAPGVAVNFCAIGVLIYGTGGPLVSPFGAYGANMLLVGQFLAVHRATKIRLAWLGALFYAILVGIELGVPSGLPALDRAHYPSNAHLVIGTYAAVTALGIAISTVAALRRPPRLSQEAGSGATRRS